MYEHLRRLPTEEIQRMYDELRMANRAHLRQAKGSVAHAELLKQELRIRHTEPDQIVVTDHAVLRYLERIHGIDMEFVRNKLRSMVSGNVDPKEEHDVITDETSRTVMVMRNGAMVTVLHADHGIIPSKGQLRIT